ncbi:MAG: hypothetical protein BAW33_04515 [Desulfobacterales bacterium C00003104]|nr:MAG: hypothetical protein BAW33_04515 [Desulfobacterales bacterium C00003104]
MYALLGFFASRLVQVIICKVYNTYKVDGLEDKRWGKRLVFYSFWQEFCFVEMYGRKLLKPRSFRILSVLSAIKSSPQQ